jgi:hypothetical protein
MKSLKQQIKEMWNHAGYGVYFQFDDPAPELNPPQKLERIEIFLVMLVKYLVCEYIIGHEYEITEGGDAESGPVISGECKNCNHGFSGRW